MTKNDAANLLARYKELFGKTSRTRAERYEMDRALHQIGLFLALQSGRTKEQYLNEQLAVSTLHRKAMALKLSEPSVVIGGAAAAAKEWGDTEQTFETEWIEHYQLRDALDHAREELRRAGLWPWDDSEEGGGR